MTPMPNVEVTSAQLKDRLDRGDAFVILDVRNPDEFAAWRIEGRHPVPTVNVPYFDFIEDEGAAIASLPFSQADDIVVVCAKGGSSDYVAEILRGHGFRAVNHAGGMLDWGDFYVAKDVVAPTPGLVVVQFERPGKASLSYLVGSQGEAIVVDPNRHIQPYLDEAARRGLAIRHVMDTHIQADYVSGGPSLAREVGAAYHLSSACGFQGDLAIDAAPGEIALGSLRARKIPTPGHTPGSTSLLVDDRFLLTGDTLFLHSVGRPDLGGEVEAWAKQLFHTLSVTLARLDDGVLVLPSHYASPLEAREDGVFTAPLGELRRQNEGMRPQSEEAFVAFIRANVGEQPAAYALIRRINLAAATATDAELSELDLGKNQCAASQGLPCPSTLSR